MKLQLEMMKRAIKPGNSMMVEQAVKEWLSGILTDKEAAERLNITRQNGDSIAKSERKTVLIKRRK